MPVPMAECLCLCPCLWLSVFYITVGVASEQQARAGQQADNDAKRVNQDLKHCPEEDKASLEKDKVTLQKKGNKRYCMHAVLGIVCIGIVRCMLGVLSMSQCHAMCRAKYGAYAKAAKDQEKKNKKLSKEDLDGIKADLRAAG